jgi:serine/threonine protein kinase
MRRKGSTEEKDSFLRSSSSMPDLAISPFSTSSCPFHGAVPQAPPSVCASLHKDHFSSIRNGNTFQQAYLSSPKIAEEDNGSGSDDDDGYKYAVKRLRNDLRGESKLSGVVDLTIEAQFLSRLSHPHIVTLHGTGGEPGSQDFFIVVGRVQSTLSDAIKTFRRQRERLKLDGICRNGVRLDKKGKAAELRNDFDRRVCIICQLASALQYLHRNS